MGDQIDPTNLPTGSSVEQDLGLNDAFLTSSTAQLPQAQQNQQLVDEQTKFMRFVTDMGTIFPIQDMTNAWVQSGGDKMRAISILVNAAGTLIQPGLMPQQQQQQPPQASSSSSAGIGMTNMLTDLLANVQQHSSSPQSFLPMTAPAQLSQPPVPQQSNPAQQGAYGGYGPPPSQLSSVPEAALHLLRLALPSNGSDGAGGNLNQQQQASSIAPLNLGMNVGMDLLGNGAGGLGGGPTPSGLNSNNNTTLKNPLLGGGEDGDVDAEGEEIDSDGGESGSEGDSKRWEEKEKISSGWGSKGRGRKSGGKGKGRASRASPDKDQSAYSAAAAAAAAAAMAGRRTSGRVRKTIIQEEDVRAMLRSGSESEGGDSDEMDDDDDDDDEFLGEDDDSEAGDRRRGSRGGHNGGNGGGGGPDLEVGSTPNGGNNKGKGKGRASSAGESSAPGTATKVSKKQEKAAAKRAFAAIAGENGEAPSNGENGAEGIEGADPPAKKVKTVQPPPPRRPKRLAPPVTGPTRTFPPFVEMDTESFPRLYRRFPVSSAFPPDSYVHRLKLVSNGGGGISTSLQNSLNTSQDVDVNDGQPLSWSLPDHTTLGQVVGGMAALGGVTGEPEFMQPPENAKWNKASDPFNLYAPKFVKGLGDEKMGLCPICVESVERGGEGFERWLKLKNSSYVYHLSYQHGLSNLTGLPFSPPTKLRTQQLHPTSKDARDQMVEGLCHKCDKWIPMLSVKNVNAVVPELIWWKHAKPCHTSSTIAGEGDYYLTDDVFMYLVSRKPAPGAISAAASGSMDDSTNSSPQPIASGSGLNHSQLQLPLPLPLGGMGMGLGGLGYANLYEVDRGEGTSSGPQ